MWYESIIERRLTEEEADQFAVTDLRSTQIRFVVRYKDFGQKMTVPLDYIRVRKDQLIKNEKKRKQAASNQNSLVGQLTQSNI